jgi:nicotinate-nucleotide pyrophosphorylase (carboxylating)
MMHLSDDLPAFVIRDYVEHTLKEDLGAAGDLTTNATVSHEAMAVVAFVSRQSGVIAGLDLAKAAMLSLDPNAEFEIKKGDGSRVAPGDKIAVVKAKARAILTGERCALNFLGHLSGIATATRQCVDAIDEKYAAQICCTRKTTPGLKALEKYAVRAGGGMNHRFGLDDAILIKDNHIAIAGGISKALQKAKARAGHIVKVEIEVDTLDQLKESLIHGADAFLLDNMTVDQLAQAVELIDGRGISEASGTVTKDTAGAIAAAGVDLISVGWITHSAACLDIGLDFVELG